MAVVGCWQATISEERLTWRVLETRKLVSLMVLQTA